MPTIETLDEREVHRLLNDIIIQLHEDGPSNAVLLENLAHLKHYHPSIFLQYEQKILYILGIFYKVKKPHDVISLVYSSFKEMIKKETNHHYTPSQASIYLEIHSNNIFSFSAPTSTGKSHLFRDLLREEKKDIVIVVPSRALIAEYLMNIRNSFRNIKNILILDHIDNVNTKNISRKIFIVTPERATEIFKGNYSLDISLFLFDEAQISEEEKRGIKFDALVRRILLKFPDARKVFAHPFIDNPQAQLSKHHINDENSSAQVYTQNTVGKIFLSLDSKKNLLYAFSPYKKDCHLKKNQFIFDSEIIEKLIRESKCILIYVSKKSIYERKIRYKFEKYINICPKVENDIALSIIDKIQDDIGSSKIYSEFIELLKYGIVIHHGSIPLRVRFLIEKFISAGFARICFATSTLLQGVNLPFDAVIIDYFRFSNAKNGTTPLDLKNLIGRSGRSQVSKLNLFDYGFVIVNNTCVKKFSDYINSPSKIDPVSRLDKEEVEDINHNDDDCEFIDSIKNNSINDEFGLPESQVSRLKSEILEKTIKDLLDLLFNDGNIITANEYRKLDSGKRDKIKKSFSLIFETYLNRELLKYERSVLSTAITILLWKIQNKTFRQTVILRYKLLTKGEDVSSLKKLLKNGEINQNEFDNLIDELHPPMTPAASFLPNKINYYIPLCDSKSTIEDVNYDVVVFDTYDYLDKVISISLSDKFIVSFKGYYDKHKDIRAKSMVDYFKYGSNDEKEIMLLRYGFTFEDIMKIYDCVDFVSEEQIVFNSKIDSLDDTYLVELISRYK
ncbi:DEAD/DEAH box helicase [uncultured Akkermansia sp.]|uniref:DEAD/DEAH box helicase n=1 Tax=uncultured Akkermansia sp. TaxID=512294 RepID=UPI0025FD86F0|nr:DEAD/DEAH box helicase [uncultured Akkermansia sp.]